jgi:hypothetical protein
MNFNGLEQQIVCELSTIVCIICKFFNEKNFKIEFAPTTFHLKKKLHYAF